MGGGPTMVPVPSPVLSDDDPVVLAVCRYAGAVIDGTSGDLTNCDGLTLEDVKAAMYENREELYEDPGVRSGNLLRSDQDGWDQNTVVSFGLTDVLTPDDTSQAWVGVWVIADADLQGSEEILFLTGYSYDMHASAAAFLDAWAARVKMQFSFNDGSGTYNVESKYNHLVDLARQQRAQGRPREVGMYRSDIAGTAGDEAERFLADKGGW